HIPSFSTELEAIYWGLLAGSVHRFTLKKKKKKERNPYIGILIPVLPRQLVEDENERGGGVINEKYETRFLCNSAKEWRKAGVEQLRLSTVDMTGVPTLANLQKGVQFALKYQALGQCVYVHCKAGRSRSATMVAAYLIQVYNWSPEEAVRAITKIRSHIHIRSGQLEVLKEFHKEITAGAAKDKTGHTSQT
uniref:Phosphatidylglycerophosphatase and protein-tyrosine phosphatase 1 n=1 Tax=Ursus maritimus TaxID=29073 RepID=A0A452TVW4_URSMA